eukprot:1232365-Pleurochrysis_carterae.AAC.1
MVWLVSEWWPSDVARMLQRSAATRAERGAELRAAGRTEPLPAVSMPAAELFGCWAIAAAVAAASNTAPRA